MSQRNRLIAISLLGCVLILAAALCPRRSPPIQPITVSLRLPSHTNEAGVAGAQPAATPIAMVAPSTQPNQFVGSTEGTVARPDHAVAADPARQGRLNQGAVAPPTDTGPASPEARVALSFVGADPTANVIWLTAINDPTVPSDERQNLIEDLNEDGFPDPHHITTADIPLIVSRIQMIESLAPDAMDQTNADAFAEAYKDLNNMLVDPNPR